MLKLLPHLIVTEILFPNIMMQLCSEMNCVPPIKGNIETSRYSGASVTALGDEKNMLEEAEDR